MSDYQDFYREQLLRGELVPDRPAWCLCSGRLPHQPRCHDEADRQYRLWLPRFGDAWLNIGRPFSKCVYCEGHKLGYFPGEKYEPRAHCNREQIVALVYSFPVTRRNAPGLTPWKPEKWAKWWRDSGAQTGGSYHVVAFVLSVWAGHNDDYWRRRGYSFDVVRAMGTWDPNHRAAFLKWAQNPWWP